MFSYFYYSVTINEFKEKFRILFAAFQTAFQIVASSSSSNFPVKLICRGILILDCLDKSIPMSL